ncbi:MAG: hypothetical protein D6781_06625 [Verrucomicrobia bacterium]|nr:MAG: hypothetical protein D6781_06625 [Verrucomicrobiota bacterium]
MNDANYTGSASGTLTIDKAPATVTLSDLLQRFDGNPKEVGVATIPAGLSFLVTYDGSATVPSAAGDYAVEVVVSDPNYSGAASGTLTIYTEPTIHEQPQGGVFIEGEPVTLSVVAEGFPAVSYRWRRDGELIADAHGPTLSLGSIQQSDAGAYEIVVSNIGGSVVSSKAVVSVEPMFSGVWFGGFDGADGRWALVLGEDGSGRYFAHHPGVGLVFVSEVAVDGTGHFTGTASPHPSSAGGLPGMLAVSGAIVGRDVSGSISGVSAGFSGTRDLAAVASAVPAGWSVAPETNATTGESFLVTGPSGAAFLLVATDVLVDSGLGIADSEGQVAVNLDAGAAAAFSVEGETGQVRGTVTPGGTGAAMAFLGVNQGVAPINRILNLSTRGVVRGGDEQMIAGFVIGGTGTRRVLVRAAGPTLTAEPFNLSGALADPIVEIVRNNPDGSQTRVAWNDDWGDAANAEAIREAEVPVGAFPLLDGSRDAALLIDLEPGSYTAIVSSGDGAAGIAIAEVYSVDDAPGQPTRLLNISTRAYVGSGDDVLIPGFITAGNYPRKLLIRAVGPTLVENFGFDPESTLADPVVKIIPADGGDPLLVVEDWESLGQAEAIGTISSSVGAFDLVEGSRDAAVLFTVEPGKTYTIEVSGRDGASGVALAEVYEVP